MKTDIAPNLPQSVFYFCASSKYSFEAFLNKYLYLRHPHQFNDLMDTSYHTLDMRNFTKEQFDHLKEEALHYAPQLSEHVNIGNITTGSNNGSYALQDLVFKSFFSYGGIICMSAGLESRFNELMWSHYAKESGFMIEFDTQKLIDGIKEHLNNDIFKELYFRPVEYKDHPTSIKCSDFSNMQDINVSNTYQKYKGWSYENEWRFVATSNQYLGTYDFIKNEDEQEIKKYNRNLYYPSKAIKRIYLGRRFWTAIHIEKEIRPNKNNYVRVYKVKKDLLPFVEELQQYVGSVFMAGVCDCSEFRHGTDACACNIRTGQCEYDANNYYITRSFELIKGIEIIGKDVYVTYDSISRTKDEDFE